MRLKRIFMLIPMITILMTTKTYAQTYPNFNTITEFLEQLPGNIAVYYQNLETGFTYGYKDNAPFYPASLNKAAMALEIYKSHINLSDIHKLTAQSIKKGTGLLQHHPLQTSYSTAELLEYLIVHSDNTAQNILKNAYALEVVNSANAYQIALLTREIYEYIEGDCEKSQKFKQDL